MTRLIWGINLLIFFFKKNFDNFRKFLTNRSIQTLIIINLNDTCSPQGQICGWGHSALETHFLITVIIVIISHEALIITDLLKVFPVSHFCSNKHIILFYSFVLNILLYQLHFTLVAT